MNSQERYTRACDTSLRAADRLEALLHKYGPLGAGTPDDVVWTILDFLSQVSAHPELERAVKELLKAHRVERAEYRKLWGEASAKIGAR